MALILFIFALIILLALFWCFLTNGGGDKNEKV